MPFINGMPVDAATGRVRTSASAPVAADSYWGGMRYQNGAVQDTLLINQGASGGLFATSEGAVFVILDTTPTAPNRAYNNGILFASTGGMCITAGGAIANYVHGCPVDALGQVCITVIP